MRNWNSCAWLLVLPLVVGVATPAQSEWRLIWADEFTGAAGAVPDTAKWTLEQGGGGWGNRELEIYTTDPANAALDGKGNLVIRAIKTAEGGYTSARLKTEGKFTVRYGKIEARIKIPKGQGLWPAFWMLGANKKDVGWPECGEIDVLENIGREPSVIHGTVHGPGYSGGRGITASVAVEGKKTFGDDFHVFAVEWSPGALAFFLDGTEYSSVTNASLPNGADWVFQQPFFLILNVAVGGEWPGPPNSSTIFPQEMTIDYVRVWQR